jgi:quinol monooxygenase YgiN
MAFLSNKTVIVARMKAKEGEAEELKRKLMSLVGETEPEEDCINFNLHRAIVDETLFMLYENRVSEEDMDAHMEMSHIKSFMGKIKDLLAEPPEITLWEMIG